MNDDAIQIYLNTQLDTLLGPTPVHFSSPSSLITGTPAQLHYLHAGKNCIYAYLEDVTGYMGFDLSGTFDAVGLGDPAYGVDQTFPCPCKGAAGPTRAMADDQETVAAIVKMAESRRKARQNQK
jgi:hypothetical protein